MANASRREWIPSLEKVPQEMRWFSLTTRTGFGEFATFLSSVVTTTGCGW